MLDGNAAALRKQEAIQDKLDQEQVALEIRAEPIFAHIMQNLDSDVIDGALAQISKDEYRHLCEDLSGPMRNMAHAGLILSDALERYVMDLAMKEVE